MAPTFFAMLIVSFLFGVEAGEQVCRRASSEAIAAGGLLGLAGIATFQAIAWMLKSFEGVNDRLGGIAATSHFAVAGITFSQWAVTLADEQANYSVSSRLAKAAVWAFLLIGESMIVIVGVRWAARKRLPLLSSWWSVGAIFGYLLVSILYFDLSANSSPGYWNTANMPHLPVIGGVMTSAALLVATALLLLGAPQREPAVLSPPVAPGRDSF